MKRCGNSCKKFCSKYKLLIIVIVILLITIVAAILVWITLGKSKVVTLHKPKPEITNFRLPLSIIPEKYYITIQPYLIPEDLKFDGSVEIIFECMERTDTVILHTHNLSIIEDRISLQNMKEFSVMKLYSIGYREEYDFLILQFWENLEKGCKYRLSINFSGKLRSDFTGFHNTFYEENNVTHIVALTHFEPIHARKVFPCFDEPALKATFDITIIRWKNMTSLSNMPKIKTILWKEDWEADIFNTSLKMSTYTVSFFVGRYVSSRNNKITVWYPPKHSEFLTTVLYLAPRFLKFFEDVLKVPYSAPKLDFVAVNWKSKNRAMENWGLIICSDNLVYEKKLPTESKLSTNVIAKVLAHETAHQWFGNLVTPKWWNDIWLSEGISTYMEQVAHMWFYPPKIDRSLLVSSKELYPRDCLDKDVTTVTKISDIKSLTSENDFDVFTYVKGGVITRMTRFVVGDEVFWNGITKYLKENAFKSVEEKDFWSSFIMKDKDSLGDVTKKNISLMEKMSAWTKQKGFPIVFADRNYAKGTVTLSQVSCRAGTMAEHKNDLWYIPISYITPTSTRIQKNSPNIEHWLTTRNGTMEDLFLSKTGWLLLNDQSQGYFVVNYDTKNWRFLAKQLRKDHEVFTISQRFKLLVDVAILLELNHLDWDLALDMYSYMQKESELPVLQFRLFEQLQRFSESMCENDYEDVWAEFLIYSLKPIYYKLGWKNQALMEPEEISQIDSAVQLICDMALESCVDEARKNFLIWKNSENDNANIPHFNTVLCMGVKTGTQEEWDELYEIYEEEENEAILHALTCTNNSTNIDKLLDLLLEYSENDIHKSVLIAQGILRNRKLWHMFYDFLNENLKEFLEKRIKYHMMLLIKENQVYNPLKYNMLEFIVKENIKKFGESKTLIQKARHLLKYNEEATSKMNEMLNKITKWLKEKSWKEAIKGIKEVS